jgi:Putative transposase
VRSSDRPPRRGSRACTKSVHFEKVSKSSTLQLTPHLHALLPEALWTSTGELVELPAPDDADVAGILGRVLRQARKDFSDADAPWPEDEYEALQRASLQRPLPMELPLSPRRRRVAVGLGFSLHADTAVHGHDRQGLERLVRYGARGPLAESRLRALEDGRYEYTPRKGQPFTLTTEALVKRLVALVPPPNLHLTSFHGVFAPHAALRLKVTGAPPATPVPSPRRKTKKRHTRRLDWAALHQHTFGVDVLRCPCGGRRRIHAIHSTRQAAEERLGHRLAPAVVLPPATAQPVLPLAG